MGLATSTSERGERGGCEQGGWPSPTSPLILFPAGPRTVGRPCTRQLFGARKIAHPNGPKARARGHSHPFPPCEEKCYDPRSCPLPGVARCSLPHWRRKVLRRHGAQLGCRAVNPVARPRADPVGRGVAALEALGGRRSADQGQRRGTFAHLRLRKAQPAAGPGPRPEVAARCERSCERAVRVNRSID
jgi:hypothetical protein